MERLWIGDASCIELGQQDDDYFPLRCQMSGIGGFVPPGDREKIKVDIFFLKPE